MDVCEGRQDLLGEEQDRDKKDRTQQPEGNRYIYPFLVGSNGDFVKNGSVVSLGGGEQGSLYVQTFRDEGTLRPSVMVH